MESEFTITKNEALAIGRVMYNLSRREGEDIAGVLMKYGCFRELQDDELVQLADKLELWSAMNQNV